MLQNVLANVVRTSLNLFFFDSGYKTVTGIFRVDERENLNFPPLIHTIIENKHHWMIVVKYRRMQSMWVSYVKLIGLLA